MRGRGARPAGGARLFGDVRLAGAVRRAGALRAILHAAALTLALFAGVVAAPSAAPSATGALPDRPGIAVLDTAAAGAATASEAALSKAALTTALAQARAHYLRVHAKWVVKHDRWLGVRDAYRAATAAYRAHATAANHAAMVKARAAAVKAKAAARKMRARVAAAKMAMLEARDALRAVAVKDAAGTLAQQDASGAPAAGSPGAGSPGAGSTAGASPAVAAQPGYDAAFLTLINAARAEAGVRPLVLSAGLAEIAGYWTTEMATGGTGFALAHNPDLTAMVGALRPRPTAWGENVAYFYVEYHSAKQVFASYMGSPGHRANILNPAYRSLGVVTVCAPAGGHAGTCFNTMDFGS